jgi:NAD+ kinase
MKLAFIASDAPEAQSAAETLRDRYGHVEPAEADVIVALGGDGLMLQTMHRFIADGKAIYGMNLGSVGFLMNEYGEEGLPERLERATVAEIHPLAMTACDVDGQDHQALAFNEVSLFRQTYQAAKLQISVDGKVRLEELICDGVLVSTPAGSTAYNLSAQGPILPLNSPLLALTPLSAFRPRRWRGAILPHEAKVEILVMEENKRPVSAVADHSEFRDVTVVSIEEDQTISVNMLFDEGHSLEERVLSEQFLY